MASQITGVWIVYSTVCSDAYRRKHQSFASLAFVRGIHRSPVNSSHKGPITRKMFPFDDVIMFQWDWTSLRWTRLVMSVYENYIYIKDLNAPTRHPLCHCFWGITTKKTHSPALLTLCEAIHRWSVDYLEKLASNVISFSMLWRLDADITTSKHSHLN